MYGKTIDELGWYEEMSTDPRDCVRVCRYDGSELVPYDTIANAYKCCIRSC